MAHLVTPNPVAAFDQAGSNDLITVLNAILDGHYLRSLKYPQWFMLFVAVLWILCGCRIYGDLDGSAKRHGITKNEVFVIDFKHWLLDGTFLYF